MRNTDVVLLQETRDNTFQVAVAIYEEQSEGMGRVGKANVEPKNRRDENCDEKHACDIVELVFFVSGLNKYFPRDVLSFRSSYVDLGVKVAVCEQLQAVQEAKSKHDKNESNEMNPNRQFVPESCKNCEKSVKRLWEYVMNIEKIYGEGLNDIENVNENKGISGLKTTCTGNRAAGTRSAWPPLQRNPPHGQPRQTQPIAQKTESDAGATVSYPGPSQPSHHNASSLSVLQVEEDELQVSRNTENQQLDES